MPATTISSGRTGALRHPTASESGGFIDRFRLGASDVPLSEVAARTVGADLAAVELWMPGPCNLSCKHCYVASASEGENAAGGRSLSDLTASFVEKGFQEVLIPGMEPLLRKELWDVCSSAVHGRARTIGVTTNGTLIERRLGQILESGINVVCTSIDGPPDVHEWIRGRGTFDKTMNGVRLLSGSTRVRLVSNTTVMRPNRRHLLETMDRCHDAGVRYCALHPYEYSDESDHALALSSQEIADAYEEVIEAFVRGHTGSIALEAEASTFGCFTELATRGTFSDFNLKTDEAGYLFLVLHRADQELLVNLMVMPRHYISTVRITPMAGLTSCREMAKTGWGGIGNLRDMTLEEVLAMAEVQVALAGLWKEFRVEAHGVRDQMEPFISLLSQKAEECMAAPA